MENRIDEEIMYFQAAWLSDDSLATSAKPI
jgi:hypothetical protein